MRGVAFILGLLAGGAGYAQTGVVIVNRLNAETNLRFVEIRAIFGGNKTQWRNGSKIVLVERDAKSAAFRLLLERVLHMSAIEYKQRLARIEYAGETPVNLKILNSEEAACKFVYNVPGAIAVIEAGSLALPECGSVQTVSIEGRLPGQEGYRLQ